MAVKSSLRSISYSEVAAALKCPASWDFSYGDQLAGASLRPRSTAAILSGGSAWGAAVAKWHLTGDLYVSMHAGAMSLVEDHRAMVNRGATPDLLGLVEQTELMGRCLEHYVEHSGRMESFGRVEEEIEVPVPARDSTRASSKYRYLAKIDGHAVYRDHPAIAEFKFRGKLTEFAVVEKQPQYRWYAWAYAQRIRWDGPVTVLVDERLSEAPKPARLVKASAKGITCPTCGAVPGDPCVDMWAAEPRPRPIGSPQKAYHSERKTQMTASHAVDQVTTPELYQAACFDTGAFVHNDTLAALGEREWSKRHVLTFTPAEVREAGLELTGAAQMIRDLDSGNRYPIRNGSVQNCRGCRFKEICKEPRNDFVVAAAFEKRPAKRDRAGSPDANEASNAQGGPAVSRAAQPEGEHV